MTNTYDSSGIEVLKGLEPVKTRPGMYTNTHNPNHLGQEVIDNSVDEAIAGHASTILVTLYPDNSLEVTDNGRGMPVDMHEQEGMSGVEVILTKLHAGGKFSNKNYAFSGGLHGVGISVVNALSDITEVTVKRGGKVHFIRFNNGDVEEQLKVIGECKVRDTGTSVKFWPNPKYFDTDKFDVKALAYNLKAKAVLCPNLKITFLNKIDNTTLEWCYKDGIAEYVSDCLTQEDSLYQPNPFLSFNKQSDTEEINVAFAWCFNSPTFLTESYVNLIPTTRGGTHVNGFRAGIIEATREFANLHNLLDKKVSLAPDDIWNNNNFVLSIKIKNPQFAGQTKESLSSKEASVMVNNFIKDSFLLWMNKNVNSAKSLIEIFAERARLRLQREQKVVRKKVVQGPRLPGKLTDCISTDFQVTELFIVEGNSAGGSARQARNKENQAILPLRGKILNTWEVSPNEVLKNSEVHDIAVAIGMDPDSRNTSGLRYGKICILADADSDGLHIASLICALFVKHFPVLVEQGHIYVAQPPLFRLDIGSEVFYALDEYEKDQILEHKAKNKKVKITRFKGLGEMNPDQLRDTTLNPNNRRLLKLCFNTQGGDTNDSRRVDQTLGTLDMLLNKSRSKDRWHWLEEKGDISRIAE